ncbi:hypothetical protein R9X47_10295 [Wukongibacter baidiensis]|uniref:hypothetical protein n=1 Tax=Wukongibacter baidiensis TaxID=1723361 RepID=UPI003D7F7CEB
MSISTSLKKKLLNNTGFFEGNKGYSTVSGNFDGQGISFGIIQFNFGQGSLEPLLKDYINDYESEYNSVFGSKAQELKKVVFDYSKSQQISWGGSITASDNYNLKSEWKALFEDMGSKLNNQNLQVKHAQSYFNRALSLASQYEITSTQGLAFLFDQSVHEWSWSESDSVVKEDLLYWADEYFRIEKKRMPDSDRCGTLLSYVRTRDGKNRRTAIRNGSGTVHEKDYDVSDFGLSFSDTF